MKIGLVHPGEMGAAVGAALTDVGHTVLWASAERSTETGQRAQHASLEDVGTLAELARQADTILSICPPHAALDVARSFSDFSGTYVDANAVAPATSQAVARLVGRYVDGGIVGPPPSAAGTTRLYLSGSEALSVAALFTGTTLEARVVSEGVGAASAVKMAYAAWTKGGAALLLAVRALARNEGVEEALLAEWDDSQPQLGARAAAAGRSAVDKGWRWAGEMDEIADTFAAAELPDGFHRAAAELFRRVPRELSGADDALEAALVAIRDPRLPSSVKSAGPPLGQL